MFWLLFCFQSQIALLCGFLVQNFPRLRFNKDGSLLAVTTADNGLKILANADGLRYFRSIENRTFEASRAAVDTSIVKVLPRSASLTFIYLCILGGILFSYLAFPPQVSGAAITASANISPAVSRVDRLDGASPSRPPAVLVCENKI